LHVASYPEAAIAIQSRNAAPFCEDVEPFNGVADVAASVFIESTDKKERVG